MPNNYSTNIVYLSKAQYQELIANQTITVNGTTVTYNENDIYVTPQAEPITDVKLAGTSIGSNGVANIPLASNQIPGIMMISSSYGHQLSSGVLVHKKAASDTIKKGYDVFDPIVASNQHESIFYGLSKVAGVDLKNETVTLGIYPDSSKAAIQNMLGITDLLSTEESSTATAAHALNSTFMMDGKLHRATAAIAIGDAIEVGTNCEVVKADEVFVKNTDYANGNTFGIVKPHDNSFEYYQGSLRIKAASSSDVKEGNNSWKALTSYITKDIVFYGLAKAAGDTTQSQSSNTVGNYTDNAKIAIKNMLNIPVSLSDLTNDTHFTNASFVGTGLVLSTASTYAEGGEY